MMIEEELLIADQNSLCVCVYVSFQMFPLPLLYVGNQISGLFGTQRLKLELVIYTSQCYCVM